jgi:hypothetical protein
VANHVGICNRASKCGYHYSPKHFFRDNPQINGNNSNGTHQKLVNHNNTYTNKTVKDPSNMKPSYIDKKIFNNSLSNYNQNNFIKYLDTIFDKQTVDHLINIYKIGTSSHFNGGTTIFWQIDINNNIRTGKLIKYNPSSGKRIKKPYVATNWIHSLHCMKDFNLKQCLFGEHLLKEDLSAPVAIVESEKTAIIALAKMPEYLWLATGSLNEFKASKLEVLRNRRVVAFPDLGAYGYWLKKAAVIDFPIEVSDYLEKNAIESQRNEGMDIADFL